MTAAPRHPFPAASSLVRSQDRDGATPMQFPANSSQDHSTASRRWFAAMLWRAFPSPSEHDLSLKAARVLDVSPRQVRNWLRCEHDAGLSYVTAVLAIAGAEIVLGKIEGRR